MLRADGLRRQDNLTVQRTQDELSTVQRQVQTRRATSRCWPGESLLHHTRCELELTEESGDLGPGESFFETQDATGRALEAITDPAENSVLDLA